MRHQKDYRKLGRESAHRKAMFRNMVTSLILHDRIETTLPKAKELRRFAERAVTLGKNATLAARRTARIMVKDSAALTKLFSTLADRYKDRPGGYTRIIRLGMRSGDAAPMAMIEYLPAETKAPAASTKAGKSGAKKAKKKPAGDASKRAPETKAAKSST
jgi:large subunit ribosomal protein L17